jgi:hypothetical protein
MIRLGFTLDTGSGWVSPETDVDTLEEPIRYTDGKSIGIKR